MLRGKIDSGTAVLKAVTGIAISLFISFACVIAVTLLINNEIISLTTIVVLAWIIHFLATFVGMVLKNAIFKEATLMDTGISVVGYVLSYSAISIAFYDGIGMNTFWNLIVSLCGGFAALFLYYSLENKSEKRRKRKRNW